MACIVGEKLQRMSRDVTFLCPFSGPIKGNLYLTNYKLFFSNKDRSSTSTLASFEVPLGLVRIKLKILYGIHKLMIRTYIFVVTVIIFR